MMTDFAIPSFQQPQLLQQALTHKSYAQENPPEKDNERLEFLGDAILGFLCGELLFRRFPKKAEGELTNLRSSLVDKRQLAAFAQHLQIGTQLRLGRGVEQSGGRENPRLLCSAFEALVGAYFLDQGSDVEVVRQFVEPIFLTTLAERPKAKLLNSKSQFQAWALRRRGKLPTYKTVSASGPDHAKQFVVQVRIGEQVYGQGQGPNKQAAQKQAAEDALEKVGSL